MPAEGARDPLARDGLEPAGISVGRVAFGVACVFATLGLGLASMAVLYAVRVASPPTVGVRPFPTPRLETSIDPRATAADSHGPTPPRRPTAARAAELAPADPRLADAMGQEARRGPGAYAPIDAAASTETGRR